MSHPGIEHKHKSKNRGTDSEDLLQVREDILPSYHRAMLTLLLEFLLDLRYVYHHTYRAGHKLLPYCILKEMGSWSVELRWFPECCLHPR